MKNYLFLIVSCILSVISYSQEREYYLETIKGEKIKLDEFYTVRVESGNVRYFPYETDRKGTSLAPKSLRIKSSEISKIVYDEKLLKPFETSIRGSKIRLLEVLLFNSEYTLAREYYGSRENELRQTKPYGYYVFDKDQKKVVSGSLKMKYKKEVYEVVKKYFGNCEQVISKLELFFQIKKNYKHVTLLGDYRNYDCSKN